MELLFSECMNMAIWTLNKYKEFYPFALALSKDNEITIVAIDRGEERPLSEDIISDLKAALPESRGGFKVAAIVDDVKIDKKDDAIRVSAEHFDGTAIEIISPYEMKGIFKKVKMKTEVAIVSYIEKFVWKSDI